MVKLRIISKVEWAKNHVLQLSKGDTKTRRTPNLECDSFVWYSVDFSGFVIKTIEIATKNVHSIS